MDYNIYDIDYWDSGEEKITQLTARTKAEAMEKLKNSIGHVIGIVAIWELEEI